MCFWFLILLDKQNPKHENHVHCVGILTEDIRHTTVLCLLGRKTLTMGFWGERGLARLASTGVCRTAKELGAEGKA